MYEWVIERLGRAGLQHEISNFARPGFRPHNPHPTGRISELGQAAFVDGHLAWVSRRPVEAGGLLRLAKMPMHGQGVRVTRADIERYVAAIESGGAVPGEVQPVDAADAICRRRS
jgi:hypothetical protein